MSKEQQQVEKDSISLLIRIVTIARDNTQYGLDNNKKHKDQELSRLEKFKNNFDTETY